MGAGAVVRMDGEERVLSRHAGHGTNNVAEYAGLILGLEEAQRMGADEVVVRGDSELILRQLTGQYKVRAAHLRAPHERALALLGSFASHRVEWVARAQNAEADAAARQAIYP